MYSWDIRLNAISTVNLVMAVGISVEFCAHVAHNFLTQSGSRDERVRNTLKTVGGSVFQGEILACHSRSSLRNLYIRFNRSYRFSVFQIPSLPDLLLPNVFIYRHDRGFPRLSVFTRTIIAYRSEATNKRFRVVVIFSNSRRQLYKFDLQLSCVYR